MMTVITVVILIDINESDRWTMYGSKEYIGNMALVRPLGLYSYGLYSYGPGPSFRPV